MYKTLKCLKNKDNGKTNKTGGDFIGFSFYFISFINNNFYYEPKN